MQQLLVGFLVLVMAAFSLSCSAQPDSRFNLVLTDDFNDPASGWDAHTLENGDSAAYDKGEYITSISGANRVIWFRNSSPAYVQGDFSCQVDATNVSGAGDDSECGIIFRGLNYDSYYLFKVRSSDKSYSLAKFLKGQWSTLMDWTVSDNIKGGVNTNRLGVTCIADSIEVSTNGVKLASVIDNSLTSGYIALELGTWQNPSASYKFDNFKLFAARPPASIPAFSPAAPTNSTPSPAAPPASAPVTVVPSTTFSAPDDSTWLKNRSVKLIFQDDFSNPDSGWMTVIEEAWGGFAYDKGEYSVTVNNPGVAKVAGNSTYKTPQDFAAEVDVRKISGGPDSGVILTFRRGPDSKYDFVVMGDGSYTFSKRIQGKRTDLMDTKGAGSVPMGDKPVRLGVICVGSHIELYEDGNMLESINDSTNITGTMNMWLTVVAGAKTGAKYKFDNFTVYSVE